MSSLDKQLEGEDGDLLPAKIAEYFLISEREVIETVGNSDSLIPNMEQLHADEIQSRLKGLLEVMSRVEPWIGDRKASWSWLCSEPLSAFGNVIPAYLIRAGQSEALIAYVDGIAVGGFS